MRNISRGWLILRTDSMSRIIKDFFMISIPQSMIFRIWKEMALNDSLTIFEKSKLAVWDYPVSDRFTKVGRVCKKDLMMFVYKALVSYSSSGFC